MRPSDFDYDLPDELVAQYPARERTGSRLLCLDGPRGRVRDLQFTDLPELLSADDVLVLNDTRVLRARLAGSKASGGRVEVLVERILDGGRVLAHVRASKRPRSGATLLLGDGVKVTVAGRAGDLLELHFPPGESAGRVLERAGRVPLPPYIRRPDEAEDAERYQTVYARREGAVAAPTAGLHFDETLLGRLRAKGVQTVFVTLHVGAGTFQPVRVDELSRHRMHRERVEITEEACSRIAAAPLRGGRVVAVGTTSVRALETASAGGRLEPFRGETDLFIHPGYRFLCVDAMITNFHLPRSTLLMLVAAFAGREPVLAAYRHAIRERYRFFSYGDAMFVTRGGTSGRGSG